MKTPDVSRWLYRVLSTGITISLPFLLIGIVLLMFSPQQTMPAPTIHLLLASLLALQPLGILAVGLAIIALSPLVGLLVVLIAFLQRREYLYVIVAIALLAMMITSFALHAE